MEYRGVWVHGIGPTSAGYSVEWTQAYNQYLNFPSADYIEVLWADVYNSTLSTENLGTNKIVFLRVMWQQARRNSHPGW
ncbi:MAG: hypothetical protein E6I91_14975 [Chloroflexi bacterium]|nr:MAG: hypothetical protein E6I91_14975 [Chloroflexota bacterium]